MSCETASSYNQNQRQVASIEWPVPSHIMGREAAIRAGNLSYELVNEYLTEVKMLNRCASQDSSRSMNLIPSCLVKSEAFDIPSDDGVTYLLDSASDQMKKGALVSDGTFPGMTAKSGKLLAVAMLPCCDSITTCNSMSS